MINWKKNKYILKLSNSCKTGFTMVELSISIFIIVILISLMMANSNTGISTSALIESQSSLYYNIRLAQSYALSNKAYGDNYPNYWGVYLEVGSSEAILFADLNMNFIPDEGEYDPFLGGRTISLSSETMINYISWDTQAISVLFESGGMGAIIVYDVDEHTSYQHDPYHIELKDKVLDIGRLIILEPSFNIDAQNCSCSDSDYYCCSFCSNPINCIDMESL